MEGKRGDDYLVQEPNVAWEDMAKLKRGGCGHVTIWEAPFRC